MPTKVEGAVGFMVHDIPQDGEIDGDERCALGIARRVKNLDQFVEWHPLMDQRILNRSVYSGQEFIEGRVAGGIESHHEIVEEDADHVLEVRTSSRPAIWVPKMISVAPL